MSSSSGIILHHHPLYQNRDILCYWDITIITQYRDILPEPGCPHHSQDMDGWIPSSTGIPGSGQEPQHRAGVLGVVMGRKQWAICIKTPHIWEQQSTSGAALGQQEPPAGLPAGESGFFHHSPPCSFSLQIWTWPGRPSRAGSGWAKRGRTAAACTRECQCMGSLCICGSP